MSYKLHYITPMSTQEKTKIVQVRVSASEKAGFAEAADIAGISLSSWVRERLRAAAIRELEGAGRRAPFVPSIPITKSGKDASI